MPLSATSTTPTNHCRPRRLLATILSVVGALILATLVVPAQADPPEDPVADPGRSVVLPRLMARATMPGLPGFSAAVANGDGTFWTVPADGLGGQATPREDLLRLQLIRP